MGDQIKMFIAGEEVVSNNEFTINEEMLSASSTILNNCYPKSWELNKDYISNFYYPKDYSKFILGKGNYLNGNDEFSVLSVEGNDTNYLSYETNVEKEWNSLEVFGNTYQETEPETYGKNLLCFGNVVNSLGLTITKNNNSQITINGTVQANGSVMIGLNYPPTLSTETYVLSVIVPSGHSTSTFILELPQSNNFRNISMATGSSSRTTSSQNENGRTYNYVYLNVTKNMVFTNYVIQLQIEQNTSATSFEPFYVIPGKPSPTKPSDLVSVGVLNNSKYNITITNTSGVKTNFKTYTLDNPLRAIGSVKDRLYIENGYLYVERKIGYIDSYNGESIATNYMSTTGELTTGASVQYVLNDTTVEGIGQVSLPSSYEGTNNITFNTGLETTEKVYYYWKNYDVLFAGIVKNSGEVSLNPRYPHYCSLQILDYKTFLSESNTLDFVIADKTIKQAIEMVVSAVSDYGFIVGEIDIDNADDIIGAYSTLNKTAYDVLQYLANISGSRWRARYVDSKTMAIDFYDTDKLPQANDIEYTKEYWEQNNIVDLTFNYGTRDYRNKQIVLSDEVYASIDYTEVLLSNGYGTNFITQNNIGIIRNIEVNGVSKSFITQEEKSAGVDADFYYTPGKNIIESSSSYTAGAQVVVIYVPLVKGRQIVYNDEEVARISMQTDTLGIISRYETRNDVLSNKELEQIGKTYIEYKGKAEVILTLTTQNKDLYNIGEVVYFNAPIEDLAQNYMVKSKKTEYVVIDKIINLFYIYELTSSFNSEKAINYFDNQRNKSQGNIQEGESITRNIDINNTANIIWDNPTITEVSVSVDGDNALNSVLNSPFIV